MSAWLLPDHLADVLPSEARHIEELRRLALDGARRFGYELVMPPLLEYLESLLTGTGSSLELQTFKLVDQLSGRSLGLRADTTPQAARIDAHLLNRPGVTRLCYCGPVLHTRPDGPYATREPLQFGAELFGHDGLEADLEVLQLALTVLAQSEVGQESVDLGDATSSNLCSPVLNSLRHIASPFIKRSSPRTSPACSRWSRHCPMPSVRLCCNCPPCMAICLCWRKPRPCWPHGRQPFRP